MKTKEETVEFIKDQLDREKPLYVEKSKRTGKMAVHYGRVELSDLIDFIYGDGDDERESINET